LKGFVIFLAHWNPCDSVTFDKIYLATISM